MKTVLENQDGVFQRVFRIAIYDPNERKDVGKIIVNSFVRMTKHIVQGLRELISKNLKIVVLQYE